MKPLCVALGVLACCALSSAYPRADGPLLAYPPPPPPKAYAPVKYAPAPYKEEEKLPPQPYQFEYGVSDQYTGANYKAVEQQDPSGTVLGSYVVNLPDGRVQTVTYKADHELGFIADVKYEGEAVYPPEPKEGYGKQAPKYPAPASKYAAAPEYAPAPPAYAPPPPKYKPAVPVYEA